MCARPPPCEGRRAPAVAGHHHHRHPPPSQGTWYISAGLNKAFDIFDCQKHVFEAPSPTRLVGNLQWRIKDPVAGTNFVTRYTVQEFVQDPLTPGIMYNHDNDFLHYQDDWYARKPRATALRHRARAPTAASPVAPRISRRGTLCVSAAARYALARYALPPRHTMRYPPLARHAPLPRHAMRCRRGTLRVAAAARHALPAARTTVARAT